MSALPLLSSTELTAEQFAFARFDFNCPIAGKGPGRTVSNKKRILAAKPTIQRLIDGGQKLVIATHMGRPEGKVVDELTLDPIAAELRAQFPDVTINLAPGIIDGPTQEIVRGMGAGEITLLQNIRFDPRETDNDEGLAREIAALPGGDGFSLYVNDAFGTCHRAHVSTHRIAEVLKATGVGCVAGLLVEKEVEFLGRCLAPEHPYVVILGGAKVSSKATVIKGLIEKGADHIFIVGAMANTFLAADGVSVGKSLVETDKFDLVAEIRKLAASKNCEIHLPTDVRVYREDMVTYQDDKPPIVEGSPEVVEVNAVEDDMVILDAGDLTAAAFADTLRKIAPKLVLWNGPAGVFEVPSLAVGTNSITNALVTLDCGAKTIIGGGDSVKAVEDFGQGEKMTFMSTGGGASLEFLEGKALPGIVVLTQ